MADEIVTLLRIDTGESVRNIADIRENIKLLKDALNDENNTWEQQQSILEKLQTNQAALKNAMYGTKASLDDVSKAATAFGIAFDAQNKLINDGTISYNALVKKMAELDQEFRATGDAVRRAELGHQIKSINDKLKEFDEDRGKYARNVGNYKSAVEGLGAAFKSTAGSAGALINPIASVTAGLNTLSATPVVGMLGLLAGALAKVVQGLKSSEENTWAWNRALAAFKPIGDAFTRSMQAVGKAVTDVAAWIVDLLEKWGWLNEASRERIALEEKNQYIIQRQRDIALENANLEGQIAQLRDKAAQKDKYTARERLQYLEEAVKWERRIAQNNVTLARERLAAAEEEAQLSDNAAETNERINQLKIAATQAETDFYITTRRLQGQMATFRQEIAREATKVEKEQTEAVREEMETIAAMPDGVTAAAERMETAQEMMDRAVISHIEKRMDAGREEHEQEVALQKARVEAAFQYAAALSGVLGSLADIYEADADADEQAAQKAKGLRVASAIVSTISGAVSAYMNTIESIKIPQIAIPLAAVNAAVVLAAGMAQVKQIQATKVGKGDNTTAQAVVAAPSAYAAMPQVRTITGASEEERLNQMASNQRVYILASDLQAERASTRVRIAETSF